MPGVVREEARAIELERKCTRSFGDILSTGLEVACKNKLSNSEKRAQLVEFPGTKVSKR